MLCAISTIEDLFYTVMFYSMQRFHKLSYPILIYGEQVSNYANRRVGTIVY